MSDRIEGNSSHTVDLSNKKPYVAPGVRRLGTLRGLTQAAGGSRIEFMLNGQPVAGSPTVIHA